MHSVANPRGPEAEYVLGQWGSQPALWKAVVRSYSPSLFLPPGFSPATQACTVIWPVKWKTEGFNVLNLMATGTNVQEAGEAATRICSLCYLACSWVSYILLKGNKCPVSFIAQLWACGKELWEVSVFGLDCSAESCARELQSHFQILLTLLPWVFYKTLLAAPEFFLT